MQRATIIILIATMSILYFVQNAQAVDVVAKKNEYILILNSHGYENTWSTTISKSIAQEIEKQDPDVIVNISYAGITNRTSFLAGRFGMQAAFINGRVVKGNTIPTVLILIGDESWMYYRIMNLRGIWEKVPVVLVNVRPELMNDFSRFHSDRTVSDSHMIPLENSRNNLPVTAIMHKDEEAHTVWLMKQLMPDLKRIIFLSTGEYQDEYALKEIREVLSVQYPELELDVICNDQQKNNQLKTRLSAGYSGDTAILLGVGKIPEDIDVPVFLLNDREFEEETIVGGYYSLKKEYTSEVADAVLRIHQGESPDSIPFKFLNNKVAYLNKAALKHFGLEKAARNIPDVVYTNIPVPFLNRYMRPILLLSLTVVILIIIFLLNLREKRYRDSLVRSMEKYKKMYDEYEIVYENMPMGLAFFDSKGNVLNRNQSSDMFFDRIPKNELADFNLFRTRMIDMQSKTKIGKKLFVNKVFEYDNCSMRLIFRYIHADEGDEENILMIILDYTNIQKEKSAKERIYSIFNFAMDASSLGVAEYNLVDNSRFATDAWYKNLCIDKDEPLSDIHRFVIDEDRQKIEEFLVNVRNADDIYFADTIRVKEGDTIHWLQCVIQLLEYGPEEGRIIVAELVLNIDSQKQNEQELDQALQAAKESDRLKNAFIANMSSDIRPALDELVVLSNRLIETDDDSEKESLMEHIEQNNNMLLEYVEQIIELSKTDVNKNTGS